MLDTTEWLSAHLQIYIEEPVFIISKEEPKHEGKNVCVSRQKIEFPFPCTGGMEMPYVEELQGEKGF